MALIEMRADHVDMNVWWLWWVDRNEIVGRIDQDLSGVVWVTPQGPHWSPMKSISRLFPSPVSAHREVQLYFERR
jgi:hypothetical protein